MSLLPDSIAPPTWTLDSLRPPEQTTLIRRQVTPITISMTATGNGRYTLGLSANCRRFRPFELTMFQGPGQTDFSGQITWFLKPKGESETIAVGLYRIEETASGKTEITTLLKQFRVTYGVVRKKG